MLEHLLLVATLSAVPPAPPASERFDIEAVRAGLKIVTDGKGHYLAYNGEKPYGEPLFYGDGKTFYAQRVFGGGASGTEQFSAMMWEPRLSRVARGGSFDFRDGAFSFSCGERVTKLQPVSEAEAGKMVSAAFFAKTLWKRQAHSLARDDAGNYYFVDVLRSEVRGEEPRGHRLFMGPKGAVKLQAMTNVVADSEGEVYASKSGTLRFVVDKDGAKEAKWVSGKTTLKLKPVPVEDNAAMIYTSLGVYDNERLGTPCDDWM